jgi:ABC-type multidrug transport system fused ATPase/permease subunit
VGSIPTTYLRELESYMTQETDLFHDSIADNIRIGKLDATPEEIKEAAQKASLHDFVITLPKGYDTPVGELGATLSGGERQRVGLARAFLRGAPLLLLDEPTSNLDSLNEGVILKALGEYQEGRTVVLVSHRKSTLAVAHRVYTADSGRLS